MSRTSNKRGMGRVKAALWGNKPMKVFMCIGDRQTEAEREGGQTHRNGDSLIRTRVLPHSAPLPPSPPPPPPHTLAGTRKHTQAQRQEHINALTPATAFVLSAQINVPALMPSRKDVTMGNAIL